jgi:membrane protease YdiL (CAAX protease family)
MTTSAIDTSPPTTADRATATRRGLLFLVVCAPFYLAPGVFSVGHPALMAALVLAVNLSFLRWDRRPTAALGLDPSARRLRELAAGFGGGALLIGAVAACVGLLLPFPWAVNRAFALDAAAYSLLWLLCGNAVEELVFRGYGFERLIAGLGHWKAQLITALLFAAFHMAQGWSWQVALAGTTVGSLLFGLVFVRWRSLPAAIGVHAAVNWTRDLLLLDPPTAKTLFAPLSPRPWTSGEQLATMIIMNSIVLIACVMLWRSSRTASRSVIFAGRAGA